MYFSGFTCKTCGFVTTRHSNLPPTWYVYFALCINYDTNSGLNTRDGFNDASTFIISLSYDLITHIRGIHVPCNARIRRHGECSRGGADIRVHGERGRGQQQQRRRLQRGRLAPARARRAAGAASVHRPDDARRRRCTGYWTLQFCNTVFNVTSYCSAGDSWQNDRLPSCCVIWFTTDCRVWSRMNLPLFDAYE